MNSANLKVGGIVLTGGQSRRMGQPKAWLRWGPEHLLQRVVRLVSAAVDPVVVAARPGQDLPALPDTVAIVLDAPGHAGPLAGIASGLGALRGRCEAAFVVACDYPLLRPEFVARLIELLEDHDAVVPLYADRLCPLAGLYRLNTRRLVNDLLRASMLRAAALAERCQARVVQASDFAKCDPQLESLRSFNDPQGYRELLDTPTHPRASPPRTRGQ